MLQEQVEKLNRQNTEHSHVTAEADVQPRESRGSGVIGQEPAELILNGPHASAAQMQERKREFENREEEEEGGIFEDSEEEDEEKAEDEAKQAGKAEDEGMKRHKGEAEEPLKSEKRQER